MFWESSLFIEVSSHLFPNPVVCTYIRKNYIIVLIIYDVLIYYLCNAIIPMNNYHLIIYGVIPFFILVVHTPNLILRYLFLKGIV